MLCISIQLPNDEKVIYERFYVKVSSSNQNEFYSRGVRNDASLVPPIRQTASIFKQPVTIYKTLEGKVKENLKHGTQDKPKQVRM